jgi:hypothetical protein
VKRIIAELGRRRSLGPAGLHRGDDLGAEGRRFESLPGPPVFLQFRGHFQGLACNPTDFPRIFAVAGPAGSAGSGSYSNSAIATAAPLDEPDG